MKRRAVVGALVVALATWAVARPAWSCGLEGGLGDAFSVAHEGSLAVALATHEAITKGWLLPDPDLAAEAAHDRADERLQSFVAALPLVPAGARSFAVLLVEPGVWTRVSPRANRWSLATHVAKPDSSELVLLASESALRNLVAGQLSANDAFASGVLAVQGGTAERARLIATLRQVFPERVMSTALR